MIASLRGTLVTKQADGVTIECAGVGYGVAVSMASMQRLPREGTEVKLLVHTHLTQDALRLYGFLERAEQETFLVLIGTSGVGPKLALAILSTVSPGELADIVARADRAALTRIPGVGAKKAERLMVELKDRLPDLGASLTGGRAGSLLSDLISALVNLGFSAQVAERAARDALEADPTEQELATLVRAALRRTTRV
jgi:holliday junction DNA helicase RuvA